MEVIIINIKNPHSNKRLSLRKKFNKRFTEFIVPYIKRIRLDEDWKARSKYVPEFLESARGSIQGWEREKNWTNEIPKEIELDLLSIFVAEYIPIENVDKLNKGLKSLIKKYPERYQYGQADRVDDFCEGVKKSIQGGRWSNFGYINFGEEEVSRFVKGVHIHGTHLSSSLIILQFTITPSKKFASELKNNIDRNIGDDNSFNFTFKNFFKFWGGNSLAASLVKNQLLEDYIIELKWRTMNEINKYFDLYFTDNKLIPPSIEVYKLKQSMCFLNRREKGFINDFWHSVGMDNPYSDISKDGYWNFFMEDRGVHSINNSLKITCNSEIRKETMFNSLDTQIFYTVNEFAEKLLPVMVMREYANQTSKKVALQQNKYFSSLKKQNPNYKNLISVRYELERSLQILKRFKNEIGEDYFERVKIEVKKMMGFEPSRYTNISAVELTIDNTNYIVDETSNYYKHFAKMIDDTVQLLEIKTNNTLRIRSFWLSIITVVLSITATLFAGLSLFYQLEEENRDKVINPIKYIFRFLKELF